MSHDTRMRLGRNGASKLKDKNFWSPQRLDPATTSRIYFFLNIFILPLFIISLTFHIKEGLISDQNAYVHNLFIMLEANINTC